MLETGGIFCRICHMWNDGESDFCSHCQDRLIGSRPLTVRGVDSWLKGQVDEHEVLRIPLCFEDRKLLRRWASFHLVSPIVEGDADEAAVLASRTRELMTEQDLSWKEAWQTAELELSAATGLPPTSKDRKKWSKWLWLAGIGALMPFVAGVFLITLAMLLLHPFDNTSAADIVVWTFNIVAWVGVALLFVGVIGWLVTALATADNWLDRFIPLALTGAFATLGALALAFMMAFSTQDGTDIERKEDAFFFFLWVAAAFFPVALIASLGCSGVLIYRRRRQAHSLNPSDTDRHNSTITRP